MLERILNFFLTYKFVTFTIFIILIVYGIINAPFDWRDIFLPQDPIPVDAIPDIGENQQIVYTEWPGRSPQDVEDQITYPLTTALVGLPGVKTIRGQSIFGLSSIYIIFDEEVDFYWSRTRILEKLNSLSPDLLPLDAKPALGPDATALGQVFWYTLEGRDKLGNPNGGWDPHELRTIQDFQVKYALSSVSGVAEVASIGGFIKEYQIEIDPNAMKANGVDVNHIIEAVTKSNLDIGARTIEYNRVEYLVRATGYLRDLNDLENSVISVKQNVPIRIKDIARVIVGPANRRGGLDKGGSEAVGGVVVARYGANPLQVIEAVKQKIAEISEGLPAKIRDDGTVSKVTIVPFYDRTNLIKETLGTLETALILEILISILVVIVIIQNLRASLVISSILPVGILITFIIMRWFSVDANIVALSGIAIAIGVMVDIGIVVSENILKQMEQQEKQSLLTTILFATNDVALAVMTAIATTVISFLPVFALEGPEGKLFRPLAFTKTFTMISALIIGLLAIPALTHIVFKWKNNQSKTATFFPTILIIIGVVLLFYTPMAVYLILFGLNRLSVRFWPEHKRYWVKRIDLLISLFAVSYLLAKVWLPLGVQYSILVNMIFILLVAGILLFVIYNMINFYPGLLSWCLKNRGKFLLIPLISLIAALLVWQGFDKLFPFVPDSVRNTAVWQKIDQTFPGLGREFMPALDEGSFLLMPTTMPHSGVVENLEVIRLLDKNVESIPEVEMVVGKWGRVTSALDPAPISMFENIINYKPEYILDENGRRRRFKINDVGAFILNNNESYLPGKDPFRVINPRQLIPDEEGNYFRQWRNHIQSPDDIWEEIADKTDIPGLTSAPKLQPIQTRLVMLQTGMRAAMGIKISGSNLQEIADFGYQLEGALKEVSGIKPFSVFADRVVGKPYLEIRLKREAMARYGLKVQDVQNVLSAALGGRPLTNTVEGRQRFAVRIRYAREYRDSPDELERVLIPTPMGAQILLSELADITFTRGPQMIRSENTFLVGYVIFDKEETISEVDAVENAKDYLNEQIRTGNLTVPEGISYQFTGNYENQVRATKRFTLIIPLVLLLVFVIIFLQFRSVPMTLIIFSGIAAALSGGFILLWLYGQSWFMDIDILGFNLRELFQINQMNLSVAVWVGFIALFGIATDDGVLMSTNIINRFRQVNPESIEKFRVYLIEAATQRIRPAMMTTATTILALLPILTSRGKGADVMIPMAIPLVGGMVMAMITVFIVPVLYSYWQEMKIRAGQNTEE